MEKTNKGLLISSIIGTVISSVGFIIFLILNIIIFVGTADAPQKNDAENFGFFMILIVSLIVQAIIIIPQIITIVLSNKLMRQGSKYGKISFIMLLSFIALVIIITIVSILLIQNNVPANIQN